MARQQQTSPAATRKKYGSVANVKVKWIKITNSFYSMAERSVYFETEDGNHPFGYFPLTTSAAVSWAKTLVDALYNNNGSTTGTVSYSYDATDYVDFEWDETYTKGNMHDGRFTPPNATPRHYRASGIS